MCVNALRQLLKIYHRYREVEERLDEARAIKMRLFA